MLTYASVCSGIEAATVAWDPLGMRPKFFAETDAFCSAVLAHHWPTIPNLGDFTQIGPEHGPVDVLVGGPPCQSFSDAGGRAGLLDSRGQLAVEFLRLAARLQARWVVFENVPGLLHSGPEGLGWLDFGTFLGALGELGFGFAYRVLDAQHFGVPQRRRRVFVVGRAGGDWRGPAAVLFERESLRGADPPRRAEREGAAGPVAEGPDDGDRDVAFALATKSRLDVNNENLVSGTLLGTHNPSSAGHVVPCLTTRPFADHGHQGHLMIGEHVVGPVMSHHDPTRDGQIVYNVQPISASVEPNTLVAKPTDIAEALTSMGPQRRCDRGDLVVMPIQSAEATNPSQGGLGIGDDADPSYTLTSRHDMGVFVEEPISFDPAQVTHPENRSKCEPGQAAPTLAASNRPHVAHRSFVRRLTPLEYERLQGFPEGHTLVPWNGKLAPDGRRYKAVGNSMAVPVMRWIGTRLVMVDEIVKERDR